MKAGEARQLGSRLAHLIHENKVEACMEIIMPVLAVKTPFATLDLVGASMGVEEISAALLFLEKIAQGRSMGGWVIIASYLQRQLVRDMGQTLTLCQGFIIQADVWYGTDIFGERVAGPALLVNFGEALAELSPWRSAANRWVRRCVGVAVHLWAKRRRGRAEFTGQAAELLDFLEPMYLESDQDAVKGIGWGLKTMGRYYPDLMADWLVNQALHKKQKPRGTMLRKAMTYLSIEQRMRVTGSRQA